MSHNNLLPIDGAAWKTKLLDTKTAEELMNDLRQEVEWSQDTIFLFGKEVLQPRLSAWFGGGDKDYTYSGLTLSPKEWSPKMFRLKELVEKKSGRAFNSALLNYYRDGQDSMGWHRDNESALGKEPVVASLSLGQKRRFHLRHYKQKELKVSLELGEGELLIMEGQCQHKWEHSLPKTKRPIGPRLNITFRQIKS